MGARPSPSCLFVADLALAAGRRIMDVYRDGFHVSNKADGSPVTGADRVAHDVIVSGLVSEWPHVPVVSEEDEVDNGRMVAGDRFFCVDPLDGTKEFIARSGDFTVNIALVEAGRPVLGVVYAPARQRIWLGDAHAFVADVDDDAVGGAAGMTYRQISTRPYPSEELTCVVSARHPDPLTADFVGRLGRVREISVGSSLKFCRVAEGAADVYPRFGPTMEWDTAAGDAVLSAAGGRVLADGEVLTYGKTDRRLTNPAFVAWGGNPLFEA